MTNQKIYQNIALAMIFLLMAGAVFSPLTGWSWNWVRLALEGGGVAHDVQLVRTATGNADTVWSA